MGRAVALILYDWPEARDRDRLLLKVLAPAPGVLASRATEPAGDSPGEQTVATGSHAWVECRLPGAGWVGFDPTNATFSDERHIRVATGRDYADVSPTRGVFQGSGDAEIEVDVIVNAVGPGGQDETVSGRNRRQRG